MLNAAFKVVTALIITIVVIILFFFSSIISDSFINIINKGVNDIRDEARAEREALKSEMQAANDEARAEREALKSEMQAANDEARAEREALKSEMQAANDEARAEREALKSEMQALPVNENDEARAEREAWQSKMQALLVSANDIARSERKALQSEMMFWIIIIFCAIIAILVVGDIALRRLENRISELERKPDDLSPAPGKKVMQLHIVADPDSQAARRVVGSPAGASTERPSFPRKRE